MTAIVKTNFKDVSTVSTELVKCLSMNISVEVVDKLTDQATQTKTTLNEHNKIIHATAKEEGTTGNKMDKIMGEIKELKAR